MPRRKRTDTINEYHLAQIERQVGLLRIVLSDAQLSLTPFRGHYEAISDLMQNMRVALNLLNDRPADYERPHRSLMQDQ